MSSRDTSIERPTIVGLVVKQSESRVPEIGTLGLMSGDGKRSAGHRPQATAPILDSTVLAVVAPQQIRQLLRVDLPCGGGSAAQQITACLKGKMPWFALNPQAWTGPVSARPVQALHDEGH